VPDAPAGSLGYNTNLFTRNLFLKLGTSIAALKALGAWGIAILALLDSSIIAIPMDPLMAGYVYSNPHKAWLYCLAAALGSALGCLFPYGLGRAGGELFLLKHIDRAKMERIRDRFERREFLAIMIPAMLPPPMPLKPLVFSAGVFEMKIRQFLLAIVAGRLARFGILSVLVVVFGRQIIDVFKSVFRKHLSLTLLLVVLILGALYFVYRMFREPAKELAEEARKS
jgi:membrane protein YqaA with SNARE-associated domain